MKVAILLEEGFEEVEALSVVDVMRRAGIHIDIVSMNQQMITSSHSVTIKADKLFEDMSDYAMVVLPGGLPGSTNLRDDERVIKLLQDYNEKGKFVAAICAGPMAIGRAGIAKGKTVTSYPMDEVRIEFKESNYVEDQDVVVDGNIITSRGPATAYAFGYALINALGIDPESIKKGMLYKK